MLRLARFSFLLITAFAWIPAWAGDLAIYEDALENGFLDYSYYSPGGSVDFASAAQVHSGTHSIAFTAAGNDAVKVANNTLLFATTSYPRLHLWFYGSTLQCQGLDIILERYNAVTMSDDTVASGALSGYATCNTIVNGQWLEITVDFSASPIGYNGTYDRISFFNRDGGAFGPVYFDDLSLQPPANDPIFKNGFEISTSVGAIQIEQNITACAGLSAERYTWQDADGLARSATFGNNSAHGSELCDFTYHTTAANIRDVQALGGAGGFGYIVSHLKDPSVATGDDSPLGSTANASHTAVLLGRHHVIQRFQLNYPRWGINPTTHVKTEYDMPVTIDWLIATGRDHPLWTVSFDLTAAPANAVQADSRAPYGEMAFDGQAANPDTVMGVAWGDHYKFITTGATPVTLDSPWSWSQMNAIPYVYLWTQNADAEMGVVQSEDIGKQDAGGYDGYVSWGKTSANGAACTAPFGDGANGDYSMPCDFNWPYQAMQYSYPEDGQGQPNCYNCTVTSKRLAWGADWGFLGYSSYPVNGCNDGGCAQTANGFPYQSYSTYIVLDPHSQLPTSAQISQVENAMSSTLSATTGMVVTSGPAGVNRTIAPPDAPRVYQPSGYDRVYGTWDVDVATSANAATIALNAGGSGLKNPIFVLHNYTSANPPASVALGGATLIADADYFASVDAAGSRLWITINTNWTGSHTLTITP